MAIYLYLMCITCMLLVSIALKNMYRCLLLFPQQHILSAGARAFVTHSPSVSVGNRIFHYSQRSNRKGVQTFILIYKLSPTIQKCIVASYLFITASNTFRSKLFEVMLCMYADNIISLCFNQRDTSSWFQPLLRPRCIISS